MTLRSSKRTLAAACVALAAACSPEIGPLKVKAAPAPVVQAPLPPVVVLEAGTLVDGKVSVTYRLTAGAAGPAIAAADAAALRPSFTLAALGADPVTPAVPAWRSLLLTGYGKAVQLSFMPAEPAFQNVKQPGSDQGGALEDLGEGRWRYTFGAANTTGLDPATTLRAGVFLAGASGSVDTTDTLDFVPNGSAPQAYDTVNEASCNACHGTLKAHGGFRVGVKLCTTCHTWQNTDPDTVDPSAPIAATAATNPNPIDLGRMVHRIHRGRNQPTLYVASSAAAAPALAAGQALPLPFLPGRNALRAVGAPATKYGFVGYQSAEDTYGEIATHGENGAPARTVAKGVLFPRDYRDCDVCHAGGPQASAVDGSISRRLCAGCHTDVWYGAGAPPDEAHLSHPGGAQVDDTACAKCHVAGQQGAGDKLYAPIGEAHVPPYLHAKYNAITAEIVGVRDMLPGQKPTVGFRLSDRNGPITSLTAALPADAGGSPVPRKIQGITIAAVALVNGDYSTGNSPLTEAVPVVVNPDPLKTAPVADEGGVFWFTFRQKGLPADAAGTWSVALQVQRAGNTTHYDRTGDTFGWPYTGEKITETSASNPVVNVDLAAGVWPGGAPLARRTVVNQAKCQNCHGQFALHGGPRRDLAYCVMCHAPDQTDWGRRPKAASGNVDLNGTFDDIEERSAHFKVLVHRIHTGGRTGMAQIDVATPFVVYGYGPTPYFFDMTFPNNLSRCTLCHEGNTFAVESVPATAAPTVANETATIQHNKAATHGASEPKVLPITAACTGCHSTGSAKFHASRGVVDGVEQCVTCHGEKGIKAVAKVHGL